MGRFLQKDTYRGDGLNLYAYCANNSVVYFDPSGHKQQYANDIGKGNYNKVRDNYLGNMGIDAHEFKKDFLGRKAPISKYDINVNKDNGELFIFKKRREGEWNSHWRIY